MSRYAEVLVLALYADEVMEPLTRDDDGSDPARTWRGRFTQVRLDSGGPLLGHAWAMEFGRVRPRSGLLRHLASLPWPYPESVQVLIHDEDDDCFGLWMMQDGRLAEIPLPHANAPLPPTRPADRRVPAGPRTPAAHGRGPAAAGADPARAARSAPGLVTASAQRRRTSTSVPPRMRPSGP